MFVLALVACKPVVAPGPPQPPVDPATQPVDPSDPPPDPTDPPVDLGAELLESLGQTRWTGTVTRDGVSRQVVQYFDADQGLWAERINPYGPSSSKQMRELEALDDGETIEGLVIEPAGWPDDPDAGDTITARATILDGSPRQLRLETDAGTELYQEGEPLFPEQGFYATARAWQPGDEVDVGFCDSGIWGFDYPVLFDFARGVGLTPVAEDTVDGAPLTPWVEVGGSFGIGDVPGFDQYGGTDANVPYNFIVTYSGILNHPGGTLRIRESDDEVADGVWVFLGDDVGTGGEDEYFLEVNGFWWWDGTTGEPETTLPAGPVEIEVMIARCTEPLDDVSFDISFDGGPWQPIENADIRPLVPHGARDGVF